MAIWSSSMLHELYEQIAALLPIRTRINLKRVCRQHYKWEREQLWLPCVLVEEAAYSYATDLLRYPYRNPTENENYNAYYCAMRDLLRIGWLDLLWSGRFSSTHKHSKSVRAIPTGKKPGPPVVHLFALRWDCCDDACLRMELELQCTSDGKWALYMGPPRVNRLVVRCRGTLVDCLSCLGLGIAEQYFSEDVLFPPLFFSDE